MRRLSASKASTAVAVLAAGVGGRRMRSARTAMKNDWRHGPSWGAVVIALLVLGLTTVAGGFGSSFYAEYGARNICYASGYAPPGFEGGTAVPLGEPEQPVTVTLYEGCESSEGKAYTFTGPRREADRWAERFLNRLAATREVPALRSEFTSNGVRLMFVGLGFILAGLALGIWRAVARRLGRQDRAGEGPA